MEDLAIGVVAAFLVVVFAVIVFHVLFLPTIIANNRRCESFVGILLCNLLGLVTGFFWFVALLWACLGATKPPPAPPTCLRP
ncbi:MAG: superinfection immunity protein [Reyranella sp.]